MRFLLDAMCGKLATYLRMCGHDAAYALERGVEADDALLALAREEDRTLVTRDVALAERAGTVDSVDTVPGDPSPGGALLLRSRDVRDQLRELAAAGVDLSLPARPERCGRCNAPLERVPADESTPAYAPDPNETGTWRCSACGQHFWRGSHWEDVRETLAAL